ncbi:hypothetical protein UK23_30100 [Lentzea aerocolonigenes]|uniref:TIR domain-containing protein n=1 Tax=Lentzea aerocolonigenes TaxID=68170 RepID=A0A0F0GS63_LENAE|nr:toll/interleukin-1 receptor domain-containing protein [Lentzea aerocolonigenes]KJK44248.1 hypothetical protein UK23_30100 [Lentzea aerocolonigenes]
MRIFVSYSRRDFHAAEALTSVLTGTGAQVWFDVEQLRPRTDWETSINTAIDRADAVVVVASPAAMASKWVTGEWRRALSQGKPVHVALVHDTALPPELTSRYDLRGRFFAEAQRLAEGVEPRGKRRFPLSPQLGLLWLSLVFCTLVLALGATLGWAISQVYVPVHAGMARLAFALALTNALSAAGLVALMIRLARRKISPWSLREGFSATLFALVFALIETLIAGSPKWPYLVAGAVALACRVLVSRSRTVHLEMPTGKGDDRIRGRLKGLRLGRRRRQFGRLWDTYHPRFVALRELTPGVGAAASYWVWCHEDDMPIAQLIARTCDSAGFAQDQTEPGLAFIVVSNRTTAQFIRSAHEVFGDRAVFVLATSVRLEEDDAELRRHQWLDFREQEPEGLYELLRTVVSAQPAERGVVTVPMNVDRFRAPQYITGYLLFSRLLLGLTIAPVLGLAVARSPLTALPLAIVTGLLALVVVNLVRRTATRSLTAGGWAVRTVLAALLFIAWAFMAPLIPHIPPVNRLFVLFFGLLGFFGRMKILTGLWLPPERKQEVVLASAPVQPSVYSFAIPMGALVLAAGYYFAASA